MAGKQHAKQTSTPRARNATAAALPKDVVLLQLALVLLAGEQLTHQRLTDEFLLPRRTAERYLAHLKDAGLPLEARRRGREAFYELDQKRAKLSVEAIDVPPWAARSLSLLLVAAALLPENLGVREAVDATVRSALRVRGMKAAQELRRLEDAVLVLENDAKDYTGKGDIFGAVVDAALSGQLLQATYQSPKKDAPSAEEFFVATVGLYKGGLYALAVPKGDDGSRASWRAIERIAGVPTVVGDARLDAGVRLRATDVARRRWGPALPRPGTDADLVITLHFSKAAAPYVLARPWHPLAEMEAWSEDDGGGLRMAIRLRGRTEMFETWVKSWGKEVQVLRPLDMALRIADELAQAAVAHRQAAEAFHEALSR